MICSEGIPVATMFCLRKFAQNYLQQLVNKLTNNPESYYVDANDTLSAAKKLISKGHLRKGGNDAWIAIHIALKKVAKKQNFILKDHKAKIVFNNFIGEKSDKQRRGMVKTCFESGRDLHENFYTGALTKEKEEEMLQYMQEYIEYLNSYNFDQTQADAFAKEYKTLCWSDGKGNINVGGKKPKKTNWAKRLRDARDKYFLRLPYAYIIADYVWPRIKMSPQRVQDIQTMTFGPDDVVIASYPKSGTTWMSELISALVNQGDVKTLQKFRQEVRVPWLELDQQQWWIRSVLKWAPLIGWSANPELPKTRRRVCFTHLPLKLLPKSILQGPCKLIYVARNPKDNAVSFYHHHRMARFLGVQKDLTWDRFFAHYINGDIYCGSWFDHVLPFWHLAKQQPDRVKFVQFEDMKLDMEMEVRKLMEFLGLALNEAQLKSVISHCSFESMKNNKMANRGFSCMFDTKVYHFMRKGKIGDWKNYFTHAQSECFEAIYTEEMKAANGLSFKFEPPKQPQLPSTRSST